MCECFAEISKNDPRYEIWIKIDSQARMPLKHPLPRKMTNFEGLFYEGDATRLTSEQKDIFATEMANKFKITKDEVLKNLEDGVFPIKADNVLISICDLHLRCMM